MPSPAFATMPRPQWLGHAAEAELADGRHVLAPHALTLIEFVQLLTPAVGGPCVVANANGA